VPHFLEQAPDENTHQSVIGQSVCFAQIREPLAGTHAATQSSQVGQLELAHGSQVNASGQGVSPPGTQPTRHVPVGWWQTHPVAQPSIRQSGKAPLAVLLVALVAVPVVAAVLETVVVPTVVEPPAPPEPGGPSITAFPPQARRHPSNVSATLRTM